MTTVINLKNGIDVLNEPDVVRIDRETKFGNQFFIGRDGNRAEVIEK